MNYGWEENSISRWSFAIRVIVSALITWPVRIVFVYLSLLERGYDGVYGSEWLLIIGFFVLMFLLTGKVNTQE